ncbi:MAG: AraC family transcriptional regulator [Herbinix sp.]|nr:AraC family transcriptional regulator [Herbinix sp.]
MNYDFLNDIVVTFEYYNHRICTPNWCIGQSTIDFIDLTYVIRGKAEYTINGKKHMVSAGNLLCIPYGSQRSAVSCPDELMECYSFNGRFYTTKGEDVTLPLPLISDIGLHKDILSLYYNLNSVWMLRDPGYILSARGIYMMILQRYFQIIVYKNDTSIIDARIKKVLHQISNNYSEPLTVQKMAKMINLNEMYFGNLFKKETGMSFNKFLMSIRVNRAEEMLNSGEYKIHEIADDCGFYDAFYFSKTFKKFRGITPSDFVRSRKYPNNLNVTLNTK